MMKVSEIIYLSIYFAVRKDKNWSKTERVKYLVETVLFMQCTSILFIIFGVLNIRTDNLKTISIFLITALLITHLVGRIILGKGKELEYIQSGNSHDIKKKKVFALFGVLWLLLSFVVMISSAILMSYLWSIGLF